MRLTENFGLAELQCHCHRHNQAPEPFTPSFGPDKGKTFHIDRSRLPPGGVATLRLTAEWCEFYRALLGGKPWRVHSCYRCPAHNAAVGGVSNSIHLLGQAVDIDVVGLSPQAVQKRLLGYWGGGKVSGKDVERIHGLGASRGYTHLDHGDRVARWRYDARNRSIPWG